MPPPHDRRKWDAIRALCEGAPPTYVAVGAAAGVHPDAIARRASRDGWTKVSFQNPAARSAWTRCAREATQATTEPAALDIPAEAAGPEEVGRFIMMRISRIMARSAEGGLDRAARDELMALTRLAEKWRGFGQAGQPATDEPTDEEIAEALQRINERIIELAREFARDMPDAIAGALPAEEDGQGG